MKKIISLMTICALLLTCFTATVGAVNLNLRDTFFENGKITTPNKPYIKANCDDRCDSLEMWVEQPDDIINLATEYATIDDDEIFNSKYNVSDPYRGIQIDWKIDDGEWLATPEWDTLEIDIPEFWLSWTAAFDAGIDFGDTSNRKKISLADLLYLAEEEKGFFGDAVIETVDENDEPIRHFDFENHTFNFRIRNYVAYYIRESTDKAYIFSDWSETVSIGKEGNQEELVKPEKIDAPTLSQLDFIGSYTDDEGDVHSTCEVFVDIPQSVYDAEMYYAIIEGRNGLFDGGYPFVLQIEYKVFDGEWRGAYVCDAEKITGGIREIDLNGAGELSKISLRARFFDEEEGIICSDWSPIYKNYDDSEIVVKLGDVNCDGKISVADARKIVVAIAKAKTDEIQNGDVNRDEKISVADARKIVVAIAKNDFNF